MSNNLERLRVRNQSMLMLWICCFFCLWLPFLEVEFISKAIITLYSYTRKYTKPLIFWRTIFGTPFTVHWKFKIYKNRDRRDSLNAGPRKAQFLTKTKLNLFVLSSKCGHFSYWTTQQRSTVIPKKEDTLLILKWKHHL